MNNLTDKIKLNTGSLHLFGTVFTLTGYFSNLPNFEQNLKSIGWFFFNCFTVHFNSLNLTNQLMHFYIQQYISLKYQY